MARENEIKCLEILKNAILNRTNINIYSNCDLKVFRQYILSAKPNIDSNTFPDFVIDGGGIEHFEITSSKETKKGANFKKEENAYEQIINERNAKIEEMSKYTPGTMSSVSHKKIFNDFSYENLLKSIEKSIEHHNKSLVNNNYQNKIVIFLMEQTTARLWCEDELKPDEFYLLHKDRTALSLIKKYCSHVNFVVYLVADSIEIIDISLIDDLIGKSIVYKNVKGGNLIKIDLLSIFDF